MNEIAPVPSETSENRSPTSLKAQQRIQSILKAYQGSKLRPLVVLLIQSTPVLNPLPGYGPISQLFAALHGAVEIYVDQVASRLEVFVEELNDEKTDLPLDNPDFLQGCIRTFDAARQASTEDKARMFGRLLRSALKSQLFSGANLDLYYEYLDILQQLSMREMAALSKLELFEKRFSERRKEQTDAQITSQYWEQYRNGLASDFGIPEDEINSFLARLSRTGCFETYDGRFFGTQYGEGKLTPVYYRLKKLILDYK